MKRLILILMLGVLATPALAVLPDEMLDDPVLEARARQISEGLRCLVCRNENIDESNADLARDLRILVRERLIRQHLAEMDRQVLNELNSATANSDSDIIQNLTPVSQVIQKTLEVGDASLKSTWQAGLDALDTNRELAVQFSDRANAALTGPAPDAEVVAFIVDRYGEYVLLNPTKKGVNLILWAAAPAMFLFAFAMAAVYVRRRGRGVAPDPLSEEQKSRLDEILNS